MWLERNLRQAVHANSWSVPCMHGFSLLTKWECFDLTWQARPQPVELVVEESLTPTELESTQGSLAKARLMFSVVLVLLGS